jgi:hypothetical protein
MKERWREISLKLLYYLPSPVRRNGLQGKDKRVKNAEHSPPNRSTNSQSRAVHCKATTDLRLQHVVREQAVVS